MYTAATAATGCVCKMFHAIARASHIIWPYATYPTVHETRNWTSGFGDKGDKGLKATTFT
jgi:hypothetical protein